MLEADIEDQALVWFEEMGYQTAHGPDIAPGGDDEERYDWHDVILSARFEESLARINPDASSEAISIAAAKLRRDLADQTVLERSNQAFQEMLVEGITVEAADNQGVRKAQHIIIVDRNRPENNDWFAVNQFEVRSGNSIRKPDIVVFLNGLPVAVFELKRIASEQIHLKKAFNQLGTYKRDFPQLFRTNEILVVSNMRYSRFGSLTASWEWFMPWRTMETMEGESQDVIWELEVMIRGLFQKDLFVDYIHDYVLFQDRRSGSVKIIAGYHQYHAARKALVRTIEEVSDQGRGRIGIVWHTQGSGKSLTMAFLARLIAIDQALYNPTILVLTDRNDLDDQLYKTFLLATKYLRQTPVKIEDRAHLSKHLRDKVQGGIVFSTIQKFLPPEGESEIGQLSDRENIIVFTDEAHRSQYDFVDGYAYHLNKAFPNASFIGFTGTPISLKDRNTRIVFGEDISVYDLHLSVADGRTVKIFHDNKRIPLTTGKQADELDALIEEVTEGEEVATAEKAKRRWSRLDAVFGTSERLNQISDHIVDDLEQRWESYPIGKAMIVCSSRRTCVRLHDKIQQRRPKWFSDDLNDDSSGMVKVIMTGTSSDPEEIQRHVRDSPRRKILGEIFKDPDTDFKVAIVCDMWLTGFDAPSLSTMYIDKPMKGHALMQALSRVNRAFANKKGGVVVDYYGMANRIAEAVKTYTADSGQGMAVFDFAEAERLLVDAHAEVRALFKGQPVDGYWGLGKGEKEPVTRSLINHVNRLKPNDPKASRRMFGRSMGKLNEYFSLAKTTETARKIRDDVKLFQFIHACLNERAPDEDKDPELVNSAIRQILDDTVRPKGLVDILGIHSSGRSIFDPGFLARIGEVEEKDLAQVALERAIRGELKDLRKKNLTQSRRFSEMLQRTLDNYQKSDELDVQDVLDSMFSMIEEMREIENRGEELNLTDPELAFYDALTQNEASVRAMGEEKLCDIARKITEAVNRLAKSDWLVSRRRQDLLQVTIMDILEDEGYPEDKAEEATRGVLDQARTSARAKAEAAK